MKRIGKGIGSALIGFLVAVVMSSIVYSEPFWLFAVGIAIGSFISYFLIIERRMNKRANP